MRTETRDFKRQLLKNVMAATLPRRMFMVRGPRRSGAVFLTFDDGPDPHHTPKLLDVLRANRVTATFFLIGQHAQQHLHLVKRMAAEGHAVGHHSYCHGAPERTSAEQLDDDVRRCRQLLGDVLGHQPVLFRPPLGKVTPRKLLRLWRAGQSVVLWNIDSHDFSCEDPDEVRALFRREPLVAGDIVLMHDNHAHAATILPELVSQTRVRGLQFATLEPWVRLPWQS
ncbi:MAG: polysaccharide deacetylase family protein [Polyangiaceae bacterium]|nr:polysaccharide deacetylase family protein [Polyangiaceae bacterium]